MKKHLIILLTFFSLVSCTNDFSSSAISSNEQSNSSLVSSINSSPQSTSLSSSLEISSSINEVSSTSETAPNVDFTKLTMGCLGDSITYGVDGVNGNVMESPYSTLIKNELGLENVYNYGINGTTYTLNNLGRHSFVNNYKTMDPNLDIISVLGGVNDYDCSMPLGTINDTDGYTFYGAVKIVASGLKELYPNSFIFFMTPYNTTWKHNTTYELIDVVNAIKEVCSLYDLPVLDLYNTGNYEVEMYNDNSDGLHPSQEFIKNYTAPQIVQFIKDNYK